MKKFLIIFGVILLLILGAVWTYVFVYGVPKSADEVFARFSTTTPAPVFVGGESDSVVDVADDEESDNGVQSRLRQLTTRPTAGAGFIEGGIRYVERGTGHMYEIRLQGGEERLISNTTYPHTIRADFSVGGEYVILMSEQGVGMQSVLGKLVGGSTGELEMTSLPDGATETGFAKAGDTLNFFVPNAGGGTAYAYSLNTGKTTELFRLPLTDVRIVWGLPTYVYTTPSAISTGYVYRVGKGGQLEYVTNGGKGLMAFPYASGTLVSTIVDTDIVTRVVGQRDLQLLKMLPEKCTVGSIDKKTLFCASPLTLDTSKVYPDDWYKGTVGFSDTLLRVGLASSTVTVLSLLEEESGRPIDVENIGANSVGSLIYLINKYDDTLWMYDLR